MSRNLKLLYEGRWIVIPHELAGNFSRFGASLKPLDYVDPNVADQASDSDTTQAVFVNKDVASIHAASFSSG